VPLNPKYSKLNSTSVNPTGLFFFVIFSPILCCWQTINRPQADLAKFGYRSERKVEMLWNPTIIWQHARTSGVNMVISRFSLKYGYFGPFFLQKTFVIPPLPCFFFG
jgi:hypothetical protein